MYQTLKLALLVFAFFFTVCNANMNIKMIAHKKGWIGYGDECRMANCKNVNEETWRKYQNYASGSCQVNCGFSDACKEAHDSVYHWSSSDCYPSKCACEYVGGTWEPLDDCRRADGFDGLSCKNLFVEQY